MTEVEIMTALSTLLDKQLYRDVSRLQELNERMEHFVANVSHEFKSPLTIIKGSLENMRDGMMGSIPEKATKAIDKMAQTADRMNRLVMDLLDLSKIKAGKLALKLVPTDMTGIVSEVLDGFEEIIKERRLKVTHEATKNLPPVLGDRDRLMQVVTNLVSNAIKFTPNGGSVDVKLQLRASHVQLTVKDTGPGIAAENLERIFDKYERITAERYEGTGLGLPIASEMVRMHNGMIWVESELGKGATFSVTLPIVPQT
jgi:two-component system sensor histidine kinase VicK